MLTYTEYCVYARVLNKLFCETVRPRRSFCRGRVAPACVMAVPGAEFYGAPMMALTKPRRYNEPIYKKLNKENITKYPCADAQGYFVSYLVFNAVSRLMPASSQ